MKAKRVVVIGGASGIGAAVARLAKEHGAEVLVASRSSGVDLRDEASVERFFAKTGAFDHLAITAGDWDFPFQIPTAEIDIAAAQQMLAVRFWGSITAVKHAANTIARDGSIVLTGGMLAHRPMKGAPLATAIGGALEYLARGFAVDLAPVRVNAVSPGLIATEHVTTAMPAAYIAQATAAQPVPRAATPAEAAHAYIYAMTNSYITGQVLPVDGGGHLV